MFALGQRWTQKPPPGVGIDWTHPLVEGLGYAMEMQSGAGIEQSIVPSTLVTDYNNPGWGNGTYGLARSYDGANQYTALNQILAATNNHTIFLIHYPRNTVGGAGYDFILRGGYSRTVAWSYSGDSYGYLVYDGAGYFTVHFESATPDPYRWYVWCATHTSAGELKAYSNGTLVDEATTDGSLPGGLEYIGSIGAAHYYNGLIACLRIWNRALSPAEVASLSANPWQIYQPRTLWLQALGIEAIMDYYSARVGRTNRYGMTGNQRLLRGFR